MANLRVVLDTNVLVSGLAYPGSVPGRIIELWRQGRLDAVLSRYILDELVRVLPRLPRIKLNASEIRDLADSLMFLADVIEPDMLHEEDLRDTADQAVLATLRKAKAQYLITGDKDLLILADKYPSLRLQSFGLGMGNASADQTMIAAPSSDGVPKTRR